MRDTLEMRMKTIIPALIILFIVSIIPVLADESAEVNLTTTVLVPPVADAGGPYSGKPNIAIDFDGTNSYDPNGTIESYAWDFGDDGTATGPTPSHTYSSKGTYTVTLTVTDGDGITDSDTTTATVSAPPSPPSGGGGIMSSNEAPVADAGPDRTFYVDVPIHFSGAGSHDPDGTIEEYHWFLGDGGYKSGVKVMHVYEEAGNYTVSLSVTDDNGATSSDSCMVTVLPMPAPLTALIFEAIPANQTGYIVDALDAANTTVTVNTTDTVTVTVIKYESNPHPEDPMPDAGIPKYADIFVSDPDAVDWPIYVEMSYTNEEVEGLNESSLGIYYWFNGTWQRCSDTGVDTERNVVWAYMTAHEASGSPILMGGIISLEPAEFVVSYLEIEPRRIELGGTVIISVNATNVGETPGSYNVTLNIEEPLITLVKEVALQGGESEIVEFEFVPEAEGTYFVDIEGMIGHIYVVTPIVTPLPPFLDNLTITPAEIELGYTVTVRFDIENIDSQAFVYTVATQVGNLTRSIDIELEAYESKTVSRVITHGITIPSDSVGIIRVQVGGLTGSFEVKTPPLKPAELVFSNLEITPKEVELGMSVTVSVGVTNVGEEMGGCTVEIKLNGEVVDSVDIGPFGGVPPDYDQVTATQFFYFTMDEGTYEVEVEGLTGSFTVVATPEPPFWMRPGFAVGIIIVVIVAAAILYANWKGMLPSLSPERDAMRSNGNEKGTDWRNKI